MKKLHLLRFPPSNTCDAILKETIREEIGEDFFFQIQPTLRIQMPHHSSNSFYPVYHSDIQNGHPPYMINIWLPLNPPSELEGHGFNIAPLDESIKIFKEYNYDIYQIQINELAAPEPLSSITFFAENFMF